MNPFQKNPFTTTTIAKPIKPIKQFDEKSKINEIKETMAKLKNEQLYQKEQQTQIKDMTINEKINTLKDMDRYTKDR